MFAGVALGVFGIAVALDRLWPNSSNKLGAESSSTVEQTVASSPITQPHDIQPSVVEPTPPISNPWHQNGNFPPARSSPDVVAAFPPTKDTEQEIPDPSCVQDQQTERPGTGTRISPDEETTGDSKLKISNGTQRDAVIRLVDIETGRAARFVYIQAGDGYAFRNIEVGTYVLRFTSGYGWDPACTKFTREPDYSEFESPLTFEMVTPTEDRGGVHHEIRGHVESSAIWKRKKAVDRQEALFPRRSSREYWAVGLMTIGDLK